MTATLEAPTVERFLDVKGMARTLHCSERHIHRLHDAGHLPRAVRLGRLLRWPAATVQAWVSAGCPHVRKTGWSVLPSTEGR